MTGGAFGSLIAQFFHLTSAERKTLLVAGAAAGMSATFAAPVAAVLLAVELLLFEWKPRSFIPVALASVAAAAVAAPHPRPRPAVPGARRIPRFIGCDGLLGCVVVGLLAGALSALLTGAVYAAEELFQRLPIHWMWWPAIGGLVIGIGGLVFPQALGVGYDVDRRAAAGRRCRAAHPRRPAREVDDLGGLARLGHLGRRARAAADDGRRARRRSKRTFLPGRRRRLLAAGQHGRDPRRHDALAAHRRRVRARADARRQHAAAAAARRHDRARIHRADAAAIDPDREDQPPRLPSEPRVLASIRWRSSSRARSRAKRTPMSCADARAHGVFAYADEPLRMVAYRMAEEAGVTRLPVLSRSTARRSA